MGDPLKTSTNIDDILAAIDALPDPNDPVLAEFSGWNPTSPDHPAADIPMPGEAQSTPTPGLPPKGSHQGPGISVATTGMTAGGLAKARDVFGEADARAAALTADDAAMSDAQIQQSRDHYSAVGEATDEAIEATYQFQLEEDRLRGDEQDFLRGAAELEQRLAGEAQADRAQYLSAYKEQLAVVRQLALQSGNPMGKLSTGEAVGLAGAQFAQGFLAAQGIQIDVSGQVDRWVDRSIQEHQAKIQNLRASAEDQLHLYELSRQNSEDEWEARQRYRGFVIAGLQSSIGLNASRFQSDIAMARGQEQIARLQIEADTTERSIADAYYARRAQVYQQEYTRARDMGNLAMEKRRLDLQARRDAWDRSDKNPANRPKPGEGPSADFLVSDPEDLIGDDNKPVVINGKNVRVNRWRVDPAIVKADPVRAREIAKKGDESRVFYADYLDATNEMMSKWAAAKRVRDSSGALSKFSWDELSRLDGSGAVQDFLNARSNWILKKVYNESGKAVTEQEFNRQQEQASIDKLLARNGDKTEKTFATLRERGRKQFERRMEDGFVPVAEDDESYVKGAAPASPRTAAENRAIIGGQKPDPGFAAIEKGKAVAKDSEDVVTKSVSGAWADFQRKQLSEGTKIKLGQPEYAVVVDHLAAAYARPNYFRVHSHSWGVKVDKDETAKEIREQSYDAIKQLALGNSDKGSVPPELMDYAQHVLDGIDGDEELSKAGEHDQDVRESPFIERLTWRPDKK